MGTGTLSIPMHCGAEPLRRGGARETMPGVGSNAWLSFLWTHTQTSLLLWQELAAAPLGL